MIYDRMKEKYKKKHIERMWFFILLNYLLSRFVWEGLPDTMKPEDLEGILIYNGTAGMGRAADGKLYAFPGGYMGDTIAYRPDSYSGTLPYVGNIAGKVGKDVAVGWNNDTRTPEFFMMHIAANLTEIDISENVNVLFSRFIRIPKVHDQKDKETLKNTIQNILNGKLDVFVSDNIMSTDARRLLGYESTEDMFLELTDVQQQDKIQYLNQYHDNIVKRFWNLYGQSTQVSSKLAQMTDDEIHSNDQTNMIYLLQCLEKRKEFAEECNRIFGTNITVKLSECFEHERKETMEEGVKDENEGLDDSGTSGNDDAGMDTGQQA